MYQRYLEKIDERLSRLVEPGHRISTEHLLIRMRGAYPTLLLERLFAYGLSHQITDRPWSLATWTNHRPELHPLDFEWYFTRDCADSLVDFVSRRPGGTLCMGTPTVGERATQRSRTVSFVDHNRLLLRRFPKLTRNARFFLSDV